MSVAKMINIRVSCLRSRCPRRQIILVVCCQKRETGQQTNWRAGWRAAHRSAWEWRTDDKMGQVQDTSPYLSCSLVTTESSLIAKMFSRKLSPALKVQLCKGLSIEVGRNGNI